MPAIHPSPPPRLLKIAEAAAALNVSIRTIWRLIRVEKLPVVRMGRVVRIPASSIDRIIEAGGK